MLRVVFELLRLFAHFSEERRTPNELNHSKSPQNYNVNNNPEESKLPLYNPNKLILPKDPNNLSLLGPKTKFRRFALMTQITHPLITLTILITKYYQFHMINHHKSNNPQ